MKIAVAQTHPVKGDVLRNLEAHARLIGSAASEHVTHLIFPELSLTGYEPSLAASLVMEAGDARLDLLQTLSDHHLMTIGAGVPTPGASGVRISMAIFQPGQERQVYSKQYLHADEVPFFTSGVAPVRLENNKIALAICYELSVPGHSRDAHLAGAEIYLASVAKTRHGMEKAAAGLAAIAQQYGMWVMVCNCVGHCDDFDCGGGSAAWDQTGMPLGRLDDSEEGLLILDTANAQVIKRATGNEIYEDH